MDRNKFPDWAPANLVSTLLEYFHVLKGGPEEARKKEILDTESIKTRAAVFQELLTRQEMARVWLKLRARESKLPGDPGGPDWWSLSFAFSVHAALHFKSAWEELTPASRKEMLRDFLRDTRRLARIANRYSIGRNLVEYFSETELTGLQLYLAGYGLTPDQEAVGDALSSLPKPPPEPISIYKNAPHLDELLTRLADDLESNPPYAGSLLARPGSNNSDLIYFVRKMAEHTTIRYGSPLYEIIAETASVFFPDPMPTKESVRNMLKGFV